MQCDACLIKAHSFRIGNERLIFATALEAVAKKIVSPSTKKAITINKLPDSLGVIPSTPSTQLTLFIDKQKEIDGVGMGVLSDGTAFLTGRGLARLCGISSPRITEMGQNWNIPTTHAMTNGVKICI